MANKFFAFIAQSIWERSMELNGIRFSSLSDFLNASLAESELKGNIFSENVMQHLVQFSSFGKSFTKTENDRLLMQVANHFDDTTTNLEKQPVKKIKNTNLSQTEIALICFYDKISLDDYFVRRGEPSKKQIEIYNAIATSKEVRMGVEKKALNGSQQASINKIARIRGIIPMLSKINGVSLAKDEADTLEINIGQDID